MLFKMNDLFLFDVRTCGGKAFNLHELLKANLNVPPFFCISVDYFDKQITKCYSEIHGLLNLIMDLDLHSNSGMNQLAFYSNAIQAYIKSLGITQELKNQLRMAVDEIGGFPLIVRSSASNEDSKRFSHAGQYESFPFINSYADLFQAILNCWASTFSPHSLIYCRLNNISLDSIRMGVIIQNMIIGEKSGVLFTRNPITGNLDEMSIVATWGLAHGLVNGTIDNDRIDCTLSLEHFEYHIGDKSTKIVPDTYSNYNVRVTDTDLHLRFKPCLSEDQLRVLCITGISIRNHFQSDQDIEWTIRGNDLFILQTRPITTI